MLLIRTFPFESFAVLLFYQPFLLYFPLDFSNTSLPLRKFNLHFSFPFLTCPYCAFHFVSFALLSCYQSFIYFTLFLYSPNTCSLLSSIPLISCSFSCFSFRVFRCTLVSSTLYTFNLFLDFPETTVPLLNFSFSYLLHFFSSSLFFLLRLLPFAFLALLSLYQFFQLSSLYHCFLLIASFPPSVPLNFPSFHPSSLFPLTTFLFPSLGLEDKLL